ncbi:unnamed protein product [Clonostachys byssicola]|uniref:homogentisate 1,2-dioxygenase n=1 Tax=Clonostachys byssicola TaxID=160290 RepID=A0A9N9Y5S1_9HYPO|nr:unnamed protein product [Clonostachys byssicola]
MREFRYGQFKLENSGVSCVSAIRTTRLQFDVVASQGNLVTFTYVIQSFVNFTNAEKDQADPTVYRVLTAKSKIPGVSLTDLLIFTPKWITISDTFQPLYYHSNMSTEIMGLIYSDYGRSSHKLEPGGLRYEASYMLHGETYKTWRYVTTSELAPERVCEDIAAFIFHISVPVFLTKLVFGGEDAETRHSHSSQDDEPLDSFQPHFLDHLEDVKLELKAAGLPSLTSNGAKR